MSKVFYLGFFMFVASTIAFIVAILTPFWILRTDPDLRGIFETCTLGANNLRSCQYILLYSESVQRARTGNL